MPRIGDRFGCLVILSFAGKRNRHRYWLSRCDCGKTVTVRQERLHNGRTRSCGHLKFESQNRVHGASKPRTSEYMVWMAMTQRCRDPSHKAFKYYGARGITVCKRWLKFENFLADMGPRPVGYTLERINNNGHYRPSNCKWATWQEQARNRRRPHSG